jgi:uncharacterized protein (DUF2062 family)
MNKKRDNKVSEAESTGIGSDIIVTAWILLVAVTYFGPVIRPSLGKDAVVFAPIYALMVILSVLSLFLRFSRRQRENRIESTTPKKSFR